MKLLTITVPCHNAQDEMTRCIESLLPGGEDVEIILVDDGSADSTGSIADEYCRKYPTIVRVIHQSEGGFGECVNAGILHATGLYFKVVNSSDWLDRDSFYDMIHTLRNLCAGGCMLDMLLTNLSYEGEAARNRKVVRFDKVLPKNQLFDWTEMKNIKTGKILLMQHMTYRTQLLRDCHLMLPRNTMYVEQMYVYVPLPFVETMYYLDVDLYRFYVDAQSETDSETHLLQTIDDQLRVNRRMVDAYDIWKISDRALRQYMINHLEVMTVISTVLLLKSDTPESLEKKRDLWTYIKTSNIRLFHKLRNCIMGRTLHLPGKGGRGISLTVYKIAWMWMKH